ncbi:HNH endonuclease [Rufibacter immobilis]|uniref:HNH endonuclease n=1 Tax=Rufibacter immobilis TaxID=1348778 RepID=UPI0035E6BE04
MDNLTVYTFKSWVNELIRFTKHYTIEFISGCPDNKMKGLTPKRERVCRFCGRNNTQTKFNKIAHTIPQLLGNKYLVSDDECDICNSLFSSYENDLTNFLGLIRTISGVKAKENIPKFTSNDGALVAKYGEFDGLSDCVKIEQSNFEKKVFEINDELGRAEIRFLKNPYTPIKVYKAFLKIALAVIPKEYMKYYQESVRLLFENRYDEVLSELFKVVHYQLPLEYSDKKPSCFIFRKLDDNEKCVTHIFYLRYLNNVYEFIIPLHSEDLKHGLYRGGNKVVVPMCPPLLFSMPKDDSICGVNMKDLSSNIRLKEEEKIEFDFPPNLISSTICINPKTGEVTDHILDPNDIVAMLLAPGGSKINLPNN